MDIKTIERLAQESGMTTALFCGPGSRVWSDGFYGVTQEHLERFAAAVRRESLEEAAKCVENKYVHEKIPMHVCEKIVTRECAAAIRALATPPPQPTPDAAPSSRDSR